jgi:hypothetical protein
LNDSLILGAIAAGQDIVLDITPEEQQGWERMNGGKVSKTQVLAAPFGETATLKNAWKAFINAHKRMFCDMFGPRVFGRGILRLKWFGYKPKFSWHQLGFSPARRGDAELQNLSGQIARRSLSVSVRPSRRYR